MVPSQLTRPQTPPVSTLIFGCGLVLIGMAALLTLTACRTNPDVPEPAIAVEAQLRGKLDVLTRREASISVEISLAKNPSPYLALDLGKRRIDLKIRGRSLRSFPISRISRSGGSAFVAKTWKELEAKPLQVAVRSRIVPGSGEAATAAAATREPWGPDRMPWDFDLVCEGNLALEVRRCLRTNPMSPVFDGL
jgi:hypothetical protein